MKRFFFHVVTDARRYDDATGTMLASLDQVLVHGTTLAQTLTKHKVVKSVAGHEPAAEDYIEVEDQDSKFLITLPFARLLRETARHNGAKPIEVGFQPIDLAEHRLARRYARAEKRA